jgi:chromosome segregation ATPase
LKATIEGLNEKLCELTTEHAVVVAELQALKLAHTVEESEQAVALRAEVERLRDALNDQTLVVGTLTAEVERYRNELQSAAGQHDVAQQEMESKLTELQAAFYEQSEVVTVSANRIRELADENELLHRQLSSQQALNAAREQSESELEAVLQQWQSKYDSLASEHTQCLARITSLQSDLSLAKEAVKESKTSFHKAVADWEAKQQGWDETQAQTTAQLKAANKSVTGLQHTVNELTTELANLRQEYESLVESSHQQEGQLQEYVASQVGLSSCLNQYVRVHRVSAKLLAAEKQAAKAEKASKAVRCCSVCISTPFALISRAQRTGNCEPEDRRIRQRGITKGTPSGRSKGRHACSFRECSL